MNVEGVGELWTVYHPTGHPFVRVPDDVGDLFRHPIVSQQFPDGLSSHTVKRLFVINKIYIEG